MAEDRKSSDYHKSHYQKYGKRWHDQNREKTRETQRRYRERNPEYFLWRSARLRAEKRGVEFSIAVTDITIPECCPVFGVPFNKGGMRGASLDRIDNSKGYVPGNVQVISRRANTMKGDATIEE